VSLKKMNLLDHRLATILQVGIALAARMLELRQLRRQVQTAQIKRKTTKASAITRTEQPRNAAAMPFPIAD
jgi:hypothetical protein